MNRLTLGKKLGLALLVMWVGLLLFGGFAAMQLRETMLAGREAAIRNIVEAGVNVAAQFQQMAERHEISEDEAKHRAMAQLAAMRYPGNGYLFIMNASTVVIMHPVLPDLVNKDQSNYHDVNGKYLFVEMLKEARAHGSGFVDYMARLPGKSTEVPKISYVKRFEPWDWYVASGVYINDIDAAFRVRLAGYLLTILALGSISSFVLFVIIRNVKRSLGGEPVYAATVAEWIADGDLTREVDVRDGDRSSMVFAMQRMQHRLAETMQRIHGGSETISDAARQIAAGNLDLSSRTEEQASSLGETAASMEQLTATVRQNADNARQANQMAVDTSRIAGEGGEAVQQVVTTMQNIAASSARVVDIISVIEGIAFQTNILALNAAVEAARAGEQGRGFAVVASEVRNLARRSSDAAKEIKALIEESVSSVEDGKTLVVSAGSKMQSLVSSVKRVSDIIGEITSASEEQSRGIEQINIAIAQMDQTTQQNAAMVEQAAGAAQSMQEQARLLTDVVGTFRVRDVAL
ncbi:methyl-accepting chemotaxis protein [Paraburkholderia phosphatilytica]|uniref:methyl-accepting chemotaxis protein n=1 Tax=Paraburkholderia phosphatilytica TaxID=2282883 RepID=UPI001F0C2061|nr:methyl-accepting chemotaxis protein [Paraburkholderia phosphatilytica]